MKFSRLTDRIAGKGSAAWDIHFRALERRRRGDDVIVLSVGDPDFDTPAPITEAAIASLRAGDTHYAEIAGDAELRALIAERHRERTSQVVDAEQVVVLAGAQCGLFAVAQCLLEPGDEVIVPEPMYVTYEAVVGATGATIVNVPMRPEKHFHVDPADIAAAVTPRTRAILLNSPHNPTGAGLSPAELEAIADICRRHDLWLISDEVYGSLVFERPHASPCALPGMAERTVTIDSLSKSHAMTGWRVGWVVGPVPLARHIGNLALCMLYGCPAFVQVAAKTALDAELPELEAMRQAYRRRRDAACTHLARIDGLACHRPEGGMFLMVDVRGTGLSGEAFAEVLLDGFGVSVLAGEAFGPSAAGHVRLSLAVDEAELVRACARIAACAEHVQRQRAVAAVESR